MMHVSASVVRERGRRRWRRRFSTVELALVSSLAAVTASGATPGVDQFIGPTSSQPLALPANGAFLVAANPDNDSVTFFDLRTDRNRRLAEVGVQREPNGVAFTPNGRKVYVANTVSGTVSVLPVNLANGAIGKPSRHIVVGTEPYGLAMTPNGSKLYVSNARSGSVSVIDTATDTVVRTISNVGIEPRGLAISNDGDGDDLDETLYVTQFLALPIAGRVDGQDDAKAGHVTVIRTATDVAVTDVLIDPVADTGFRANGDALARVAPGANFIYTTGAYPNQLNGIGLHGDFAYLPNTGASPNGPVRFDVNTHSLLAVLDRRGNADTHRTLNAHLAVAQQPATPRLFMTQPWAIAFKNAADEGYVVSAASNVVFKVAVNPVDGSASVARDPLAPTRVLQLPVGKNPRGIVVNGSDSRAYVMNYVSRDVSVIDLTTVPETVMATMRSANLPTAGTPADAIHAGKELYNTSTGEFDPAVAGGPAITGRMSNGGWGSCAACHTPFGLTDNVVWIFAAGPRRTLSQHQDFSTADPSRNTMRVLNWSATRDEQEDFERNIRDVSGGQGILVQGDGVTPDPDVADLLPRASGGRNQLRLRGVGGWDALKAFVQFGIRAPIAPGSALDPDVVSGRALFIAANCQQCHGGAQWTSARVRFTPPPAAGLVANGQLAGELRQVGTFDPTFFNEVRANVTATPLGANGFVPPSLLSLHAFPQTFFHGGAARSLGEVLNNVRHRSSGTAGVDTLSSPADRAKIVRFLLSIDASTPPVP